MSGKGKLLVIGRKPVLEAIHAGKTIDKVLLDRLTSFPELVTLCKQQGIVLRKVPREKLDQFSGQHQGVVAFISPVEFTDLDALVSHLFEQGRSPLLLMLDRITDVGNFGAISRSAEVLGADALVFPERESAELNALTVKRSAGALLRVPLCRVRDLPTAVKRLKDSGIAIVAMDGKGKAKLAEVDFNQPIAVIMGSEGEGIDKPLIKLADQICRIPQSGETDSLNVSVAAGIVLYEAHRQRNA